MIASPQISVIIPTRNREAMLTRAVQSALAQTDVDIEVIVVDDGSDPEIQRSNLPDTDRLILIRNYGPYGAQRARSVGLLKANGEYAAFLDSDDWWHPSKLKRQLDLACDSPNLLVACRVIATRGTMARIAPWRTLRKNERVETFLYVHDGMLQSSTVFANRLLLIDLLSESIGSVVHNDTRIFIAAQKANKTILQMADALSYFDDAPRKDRVSYDASRLAAAELWFQEASSDWTEEARSGFMLTDLVKRSVNAGQRLSAWRWLIKAWHPGLRKSRFLKQALYIICNGSPRTVLLRLAGTPGA